MAYVPDYTSDDMSNSIIDVLVTVILILGSFAAIIALVLLAKFLSGKKVF